VEFSTILWFTVLASLVASIALFSGAFGLLEELGRGGLATEERAPAPPPLSAAGRMEREEEIRQLVQARHDRRLARGKPGINVESEVRRLLEVDVNEPASDPKDAALREEIRQLVIARNERRSRRGEPPLDVAAEIERQLAGLRG
jgi:hypothetical protein